jgi:hypothetical protein
MKAYIVFGAFTGSLIKLPRIEETTCHENPNLPVILSTSAFYTAIRKFIPEMIDLLLCFAGDHHRDRFIEFTLGVSVQTHHTLLI